MKHNVHNSTHIDEIMHDISTLVEECDYDTQLDVVVMSQVYWMHIREEEWNQVIW